MLWYHLLELWDGPVLGPRYMWGNLCPMDNEFIYGKNDLYALVIILKSLLKDNEVKDMINEVDKAISNLEFNLRSIPIDKVLDRMGFPNNYMDIVDIEKKELF